MVEVKNHLGQSLLRIIDGNVLNFSDQTIARVEGDALFNLQGQQLAKATTDGFETHAGSRFRIDGDALLDGAGATIASISGDHQLERSLGGAAFVVFCTDGP